MDFPTVKLRINGCVLELDPEQDFIIDPELLNDLVGGVAAVAINMRATKETVRIIEAVINNKLASLIDDGTLIWGPFNGTSGQWGLNPKYVNERKEV